MTRMTIKARVDSDGMLRVNVPLGAHEADQEVQVTVEALPAQKTMTPSEWASWVEAMAGTWQGDFERPPQGKLQERDPF
jgi:hypothetical protein